MNFLQFKLPWSKFILAILSIAAFIANSGFSTTISNPQAISYIEPFLYPPYYGSTNTVSVFDHYTPANNNSSTTVGKGEFVTFQGNWADCPNSIPPNCKDEDETVFSYDNHEGLDYGIVFAPVLASADTTKVDYAGWHDPGNRTYGFGLMVILKHPNGYGTLYGHLSSLAVSKCGDILTNDPSLRSCQGYSKEIKQGSVIGISGNTGNSGGPHLHFSVLNFAEEYQETYKKYMDPYGWHPEQLEYPDYTEDPAAEYSPANTLWIEEGGIIRYPDVSISPSILPSGPSLPIPPASDSGVQPVDNSDNVNFELVGDSSCWNRYRADGLAVQDYYFYTNINIYAENCSANWKLPASQTPGLYDVYVHLAWTNSANIQWAEVVRYKIFSGNPDEPIAEILLNGKQIVDYVLESSYSNDPTVSSGWIYIGQYQFSQSGNNFVKIV